jgi:hypothetical protein
MFTTDITVLVQWKRTFAISLFFEEFVVFVVFGNVPKCVTHTTFQSNCLSWAFFLFCHKYFLQKSNLQRRSIHQEGRFAYRLFPSLPLYIHMPKIFLCQVKDSNLRRRVPADLQSALVGHLSNLALFSEVEVYQIPTASA